MGLHDYEINGTVTDGRSKAPGGYGTVHKDGYRRVVDVATGRYVLEHVLVWERNNGPIPDGCEIHHKNRDRMDNDLENLECLGILSHRRIHWGYQLIEGNWWKKCNRCGIVQPIEAFTGGPDHPESYCRPCIRIINARHKHGEGYEPCSLSEGVSRARQLKYGLRNAQIRSLNSQGRDYKSLSLEFHISPRYVRAICLRRDGV
jgi:hypothetical protein